MIVGARSSMHITIANEEETASGWLFAAQARNGAGGKWSYRIGLSWADYNLWSPDGADRPEEVARAALRFLLEREPAAEIADEFDLARIRRRYADADAVIPALVARP